MDEKWHGTYGGYTNHACRCEMCHTAYRAWFETYRERARINARAYAKRNAARNATRARLWERRHAAYTKAQARARFAAAMAAVEPHAINNRQPWSGPEDLIVLNSRLTDMEIASLIGRTYSAIGNRRTALRKQLQSTS